jgi:hypothetical protein
VQRIVLTKASTYDAPVTCTYDTVEIATDQIGTVMSAARHLRARKFSWYDKSRPFMRDEYIFLAFAEHDTLVLCVGVADSSSTAGAPPYISIGTRFFLPDSSILSLAAAYRDRIESTRKCTPE